MAPVVMAIAVGRKDQQLPPQGASKIWSPRFPDLLPQPLDGVTLEEAMPSNLDWGAHSVAPAVTLRSDRIVVRPKSGYRSRASRHRGQPEVESGASTTISLPV
ncbi:hypothetical protein ON010_g3315 [Phytophthora cinnamomi]|nr:hypothetical protein ON010_g3315 [Phytophthora cinnamomi]